MQERYEPFCADFGPVNLGILHQFCQMMQERMNDERLSHRHLVYYADDNPEVRTNVALLVAAYTVTSPRPCLMLAHCALSVPDTQVCCHGWTKLVQPYRPFCARVRSARPFGARVRSCRARLCLDQGVGKDGETKSVSSFLHGYLQLLSDEHGCA
jgi:hypothetical protein